MMRVFNEERRKAWKFIFEGLRELEGMGCLKIIWWFLSKKKQTKKVKESCIRFVEKES